LVLDTKMWMTCVPTGYNKISNIRIMLNVSSGLPIALNTMCLPSWKQPVFDFQIDALVVDCLVVVIYDNKRHVLLTYFDGSGMPKFMESCFQKWVTGLRDGILELWILVSQWYLYTVYWKIYM
jgi:hypothetical protein